MDTSESGSGCLSKVQVSVLEQTETREKVKGYKTELDPNNVQCTALLRHSGAARWAYNYGLRRKIDAFEDGEKSPSAIDLCRELVVLKNIPVEEGGAPWLYDVSKCAPQAALRNLDRAFSNFFRRCKSGNGKPGFPKFKSRKRGIGSFTLEGGVRVEDGAIRLPRIGWLRLKEEGYLPTAGVKIFKATVSERAGRWFVSLTVEEKRTALHPATGEPIGIDVGIKSMAVLSDGTVFENPRALRAAERRLRTLHKSVSRKQQGSANRKKAKARLELMHYRIACIRGDAIHKATSTVIAKQPSAIVIESLNVAGMMKNHCLARAVSDASMAEFHRQIRYKAAWAGILVLEADRWFPSSKMCSVCGHVLDKLPLGTRRWTCPECGAQHDRDLNAAINLKHLAASSAAGRKPKACCLESSGRIVVDPVKLSIGQEPNIMEGSNVASE